MIEPKLSYVKNGTILTAELINSIIKRIEYVAEILYQSKLVAGKDIYVEPHFDGTRISFLRPVGGGSKPSFRGGIIPFPYPSWPNNAPSLNYDQFLNQYGVNAPGGFFYKIPGTSLSFTVRGYELGFDFSEARVDQNGNVVGALIISPLPFKIYYEDGGTEFAFFDGENFVIIPRGKIAQIVFAVPEPEIAFFVNGGQNQDYPLNSSQFLEFYKADPGQFIKLPSGATNVYLNTSDAPSGTSYSLESTKPFILRLSNGVGILAVPSPGGWFAGITQTGGLYVVGVEFGASDGDLNVSSN